MNENVDLSQEINPGMPVYPGLPEVKISLHASHEEIDKSVQRGIRISLAQLKSTHA
jgi:kynurenine formamidase